MLSLAKVGACFLGILTPFTWGHDGPAFTAQASLPDSQHLKSLQCASQDLTAGIVLPVKTGSLLCSH